MCDVGRESSGEGGGWRVIESKGGIFLFMSYINVTKNGATNIDMDPGPWFRECILVDELVSCVHVYCAEPRRRAQLRDSRESGYTEGRTGGGGAGYITRSSTPIHPV